MSHSQEAGERISAFRKRRQLTQHGLAARANVSYSLLTKVESGSRPASDAFVAACARAMGVEIAAIIGDTGADSTRDERLGGLLAQVQTQLDLFDLDPDETIRPRSPVVLREAVRQMNQVAQAAKYEPTATVLPSLFAELQTAAHLWTGSRQAAAWGLLAEAYRCAHTVGIATGYPDMSLVALSRMDWAARRAGDRAPGLRAAREYLRVTAYLRKQDYDTCWSLNAAGRAHLEGTDQHTPGSLIAGGQLNLGAAVLSARVGDASATRDYLDEARHHARLTGEDLETFWFGFGPTNVAVHRVMTLIELGDYSHAIRLGETIEFPAEWLPTRIGHHHFDMARAYQRMSMPDEAVRHLQLARQSAPGQARRHPSVRSVVTDLLRMERHPSGALTRYAGWIGM
ncbi:helix-turn-helix domain-containing protein [Kribbella qitaiheensis]|uniref:helix-turn-helix domain-containing protein n=1 Tax=Kribbella qitaiheensis TaxID=1544730 RepID=UPI00360E210F